MDPFIFAAWVACAAIGWLIIAGYWWRRHLDLTVGDAILFGVMSVLGGPIALATATALAIAAIVHDAFSVRMNTVVWRRAA